MSYQDRWVLNRAESKGQRQCQSRYEAVSTVLTQYVRPVTMLDLGADLGYFSIRSSLDYDCVSVAIDGGGQLLPVLSQNPHANVVFLQHRITLDELERLSTCEHFDVVLALNVCHHFPGPASRVLKAVMSLGDNVIIETPPPSDIGACGQPVIPDLYHELQTRAHQGKGMLIAETPSHTSDVHRPMYLFTNPKVSLTRPYIDAPKVVDLVGFQVKSTTDDKRLYNGRTGEERSWIPGINLRTWQRLGGRHPSATKLAANMRRLGTPVVKHGDMNPWNYVMDGRGNLSLIDCYGDGKSIYDDNELLAKSIAAILECDK